MRCCLPALAPGRLALALLLPLQLVASPEFAAKLEIDPAGNWVLSWPGQAGTDYTAESSTDLGFWTALPDTVANADGELSATVRPAGAAGPSRQFWRIVTPKVARADLLIDVAGPGAYSARIVNSSSDEFLRISDAVSFAIPSWSLWTILYPESGLPEFPRLQQLQATFQVTLPGAPADRDDCSLPQTEWRGVGMDPYPVGFSPNFILGDGIHDLQVGLTVTDRANPAALVIVPPSQVAVTPVFGGSASVRSLLFDTNGAAKRERVIERGGLLTGAALTIGVSEGRLDQITDRNTLNLQIGVMRVTGRFGPVSVPIYGALRYETTLGYSFDAGTTWAEVGLAPNRASRILGPDRTSYEATIQLPETPTQLQVYLRVAAWLDVDYSLFKDITDRWYSDGQHVVLRDAFDPEVPASPALVFPVQAP